MERPNSIDKSVEEIDSGHLRLLSIFHFVFAGLGFLGFGFLMAHYLFMKFIFENAEDWENGSSGPPPEELLQLFLIMYVFFAVVLALFIAANVISGIFLRKRKNWLFSIVIASLNCLQIPFGTILGVFTLIVLLRESVKGSYSQTKRRVDL